MSFFAFYLIKYPWKDVSWLWKVGLKDGNEELEKINFHFYYQNKKRGTKLTELWGWRGRRWANRTGMWNVWCSPEEEVRTDIDEEMETPGLKEDREQVRVGGAIAEKVKLTKGWWLAKINPMRNPVFWAQANLSQSECVAYYNIKLVTLILCQDSASPVVPRRGAKGWSSKYQMFRAQ